MTAMSGGERHASRRTPQAREYHPQQGAQGQHRVVGRAVLEFRAVATEVELLAHQSGRTDQIEALNVLLHLARKHFMKKRSN